MKTKLLKGLDKKGVELAKEDFAKAVGFRKSLAKVLNEEIEALRGSMEKDEAFNCPNWEYFQADRIAQVKSLKRVISYLNEEK